MNPFSYGTVVKEPYFFNRTEEVRRIVDTLGGGNNLVLYAPRRYGKTSVVMKAMEALRAQGFVCIYFDFMTVYSRESFIEAFSKAVLRARAISAGRRRHSPNSSRASVRRSLSTPVGRLSFPLISARRR